MLHILFASIALVPATISVRVEGDGYLRFAREGRVVYASKATFHVAEGHLVADGGAEPLPAIDVPEAAASIQIDLEGSVTAIAGDKKLLIGHLVLALFPKSSTIIPDGAFWTSSDRPSLSNAGEGLNGIIRQLGAEKPMSPASITTPAPHIAQPVSIAAAKQNVITGAKTSQGTVAGSAHSKPLANNPDTAEIQLHPESIVPGESFTLGDVSDIHADFDLTARLAAIDLGRAPTVGVLRGLDSSFVLSKIRTAGIKPDHLTLIAPSGAHVLRASQTIDRVQLLQSATEAIKESLGVDLSLRIANEVADAVVPVGVLELRPSTPQQTSQGFSLMIDIRVDDKHFTSRNLLLTPAKGSGLGVKSGQVVKISVRLNGASLEIGGRTRGAAYVGQTVTVVTDTGAVKQGVVTGPDTVEVKL